MKKKPTRLDVHMRVKLKGFSATGRSVEGLKGEICEIQENGTMAVKLDPNLFNLAQVIVYASQCTRLIPKKP